ncbi:MAG: S8 family serine peptidase [Thermoplasmatota archaeon]
MSESRPRIYGIAALVSVFLLVLAAAPSIEGLKNEGIHSVRSRSYDLDGNGIDDEIDRGVQYPVNVFIHVADDESVADVSKHISDLNVRILAEFHILPVISAEIADEDVIDLILHDKNVISVEYQRAGEVFLDTASPGSRAGPSDLYSPDTAHDLGYKGDGITIAFIDSGIDNEHPTFRNAFAAGVDFTKPETPLTPRDGSFDPDDTGGHGTGVASIAIGRGGESGEYVGIAPEAGLIDLKIMSRIPAQIEPVASYMLEAIQWCSDNIDTEWPSGGYSGVDIIDISLGIGPIDGAIARAIDAATGEGIKIVMAAGNSGGSYSDQTQTSWPDLAIIVGGTDDGNTIDRDDDAYWSQSTFGPRTDDGDLDQYDEMKPDVVAPAVGITFASYARFSNLQGAEGWASGSGTSYSAPIGAGVLALMLEANPELGDTGKTKDLIGVLHRSSESRDEPYDEFISDAYNERYGYGIIDAYQAVREAVTYSGINHRPLISSFTVKPNQTTVGSECRVEVKATDQDEDPLSYLLTASDGTISGDGPIWTWRAPLDPGTYYLDVEVTDPDGGSDTAKAKVIVEEGEPNSAPSITSFTATKTKIMIEETTTLRVIAIDQEGDELTYEYEASMGSIEGDSEQVTYRAPSETGIARIRVTVTDPFGGSDTDTLDIQVMDDTTNRPPVIKVLNVNPSILQAGQENSTAVIYAVVEDPDGQGDIDKVFCDLSSMDMGGPFEMFDNGVPPDLDAGDLEYSFEIQGLNLVEPGIYTINVTVLDLSGASSSLSAQLEIISGGSANYTSGKSKSLDPRLVAGGIGMVVVVLFIIVMLLFARSRKRNKTAQPPPSFRPVEQNPYAAYQGGYQQPQSYQRNY